MKAIRYDQPGPAENLYIGEWEMPSPGPGQLLVRIAATALNRADIFQRQGNYPPPPGASPILGLELAGTVMDTGSDVTDFNVGDNICALVSGGAYAQWITIDQEMALRLPERLSFTKAAAIPEAFLTAFQALFTIADLQAGETLLLHAAASGVGTAAIQLARMAGATVIATASAPKHELCRQLGADHTIDYRRQDFAAETARLTEGRGVDVVVDFVGGPNFEPNLNSLATDGRLVMLSFLGGPRTEAINLAPILRKRLQITGSTLRSRSSAYKQKLTADFRDRCWAAFASGELQPVVDSIYDWEDAADAHRYMEGNHNQGKIVLTIGE